MVWEHQEVMLLGIRFEGSFGPSAGFVSADDCAAVVRENDDTMIEASIRVVPVEGPFKTGKRKELSFLCEAISQGGHIVDLGIEERLMGVKIVVGDCNEVEAGKVPRK